MDCQTLAFANYPSFLQELPDEIFVKTVDGDLEKKSPYNAIKTLSNISQTSKILLDKVNACWPAFIQHAGNTSLLLSPFYPKIAPENSRQFIVDQFPTIKKWRHTDLKKWIETNPEVKENLIDGGKAHCLTTNHLGNPELWMVNQNGNKLTRVDLMTSKHSPFDLPKYTQINCVHQPCIVSSDKWTAVYSKVYCEHEVQHEIIIMDNSGKCFERIPTIEDIRQLHGDGEFLYALWRYGNRESKLLQFDTKNWKAHPKELELPDNILQVYFGSREMFFVCQENVSHQLIAVKKDDCFSDSKPTLIKTDLPDMYLLKAMNEGFLTVHPNSNPYQTCLVQWNIKNSQITKKHLYTFPIYSNSLDCFDVQQDKIFILQRKFINSLIPNLSILCYNLTEGQFIREFIANAKHPCVVNDRIMTLVASPECVQLVYNSVPANGANNSTTLFELDYRV